MGEISRLYAAEIVPGNPNDATQVSAELTNIVTYGVNDNFNRQGAATPNAGDISITDNANRIDANEVRLDDLDTAVTGRVSVNEADISQLQSDVNTLDGRIDDIDVILEGKYRVLEKSDTTGPIALTMADITDYDMIMFTGTGFNSDISVTFPSVTSLDVGVSTKITAVRNAVGGTTYTGVINATGSNVSGATSVDAPSNTFALSSTSYRILTEVIVAPRKDSGGTPQYLWCQWA